MFQRASESRVPNFRTIAYPGPNGGLWTTGNNDQADPNQCEVLDNFIPTAKGARLRGGAREYADCGAEVRQFVSYANGSNQDLLACTTTKIFDCERLNSGGSNTFAEYEGLTSGLWGSAQMSTAGGVFSVMVNGADFGCYWDGSEFNPIVDQTINNLNFDALTAEFDIGETVTGGTSGASGVIYGIVKSSATAGILKIGTITAGPFSDNETITSASGSATSNIPSGTSTASSVAFTGIASSSLSQVFSFKERLFFIEQGAQSFWYLPVKQIGGTLSEFDLGPVLNRGGRILFGASWSRDTGEGPDDLCIFVSAQGEVIVYQGSDPSSASTWALVGVYDISRPLNKFSWFKMGSDVCIMTEEGIVKVSEALQREVGREQSSLTFPIQDLWQSLVLDENAANPVRASNWTDRALLLVGTPAREGGLDVGLIMNTRTMAWARVLGWDIQATAVSNGACFFGDSNGKVFEADEGGTDDGGSYSAKWVPKFSDNGDPAQKSANSVQAIYKATTEATIGLACMADWEIDRSQYVIPVTSTTEAQAIWGTAVWGTFIWGGNTEPERSFQLWDAVTGTGYSLSPAIVVTSNQTDPLPFELVRAKVRYEAGYEM